MLSWSFKCSRSLVSVSSHSLINRSLHTLVIGEHNNSSLSDTTYSTITAAKQLNENEISVLIASDCEENCNKLLDESSKIDGINRIITCKNSCFTHLMPETLSNLVVNCQNKYNFSHIMAGVSSFSRDVIPRIGGILDISQISDVTSIFSESSFERPIYAGNAICKVSSIDNLKLITTRLTSFPFEKISNNNNDNIEIIDESSLLLNENIDLNKEHISDELSLSTNGPSLQSASIVISGGRGMQNGENFKLLYDLCKLFGDCAVGASRAAVDAGFVGNDLQVGQTGKVVAPNLYIAVGISGAIQHIAGMKDSKLIVAINKDEEAPIFSISDYGLKMDLFDAIPQLTEKIK